VGGGDLRRRRRGGVSEVDLLEEEAPAAAEAPATANRADEADRAVHAGPAAAVLCLTGRCEGDPAEGGGR